MRLVDTQSRFSRQAPTSSKVGGGRPSSVATEMVQSILWWCSAAATVLLSPTLYHRHKALHTAGEKSISTKTATRLNHFHSECRRKLESSFVLSLVALKIIETTPPKDSE